MNPNIRAKEIVAAFKHYLANDDESEIAKYSPAEMRSADEQLGQRDQGAGFRIAMQNRIRKSEAQASERKASYVRVIGHIVTFVVGVLATLAAQWLMK
ncbi:hypothetical protein [Thiohalomonas denitrificans]|uniref:hypothetical protein n=1 Tax=Thiohalomonas denitrificans TaxID=415747 RepID=UPI0026F00485|nr:hypothetical protein [Thiohalomonas denitrificans]